MTVERSANHVYMSAVTKRFGDRMVLDGVTMNVTGGETVALIGPSGGGKSTILRCINGLNAFDSGHVEVGPYTLQPNGSLTGTAHVRHLFGMVFQDFQLFPHMTALQNVMEAPRQVLKLPKDVAGKRAWELLNKVGLADRADAYPRQLSGGQKQRVAIARALAMEPRGLLCDEITSALDPELKSEVLTTLEDLKREGLTLIVVTHEIHFARRAADRVFVLAEGRIIEQGAAAEVIDNPQHERTQRFLSQVFA